MAARVFVWRIEDAAASSWDAEIAVYAPTRPAALRTLREAGLHKRQISDEVPAKTVALGEYGFAANEPGVMFRRRYEEEGWADWERLPPGTTLP